MPKLSSSSLPLAAAATLLLACGDDDSTSSAPSASGPETTQPVRLRVAHLSPDAPAVDVCLAAAGTGRFDGPVLEAAGGTAGLEYGQVTRYLDVDAGTYDVRVVAASASDCAMPIVPDTTGVTLGGERALTVAATGLAAPAAGEPGFALVPFVDDAQVAAGKAKVRFIHASPGTPAVDVGAGSGDGFTPLFTAVEFSEIDEALGPTGYLETEPLSDVTLSARATGTSEDALVVEGASLPAGAIITVFATGLLGGDPPLAALVCSDDSAATALLSRCAFAP
jgi:hypothetical protein